MRGPGPAVPRRPGGASSGPRAPAEAHRDAIPTAEGPFATRSGRAESADQRRSPSPPPPPRSPRAPRAPAEAHRDAIPTAEEPFAPPSGRAQSADPPTRRGSPSPPPRSPGASGPPGAGESSVGVASATPRGAQRRPTRLRTPASLARALSGISGASGIAVRAFSSASLSAIPGCLAHCLYYALAFFAYWFGAARFDVNGDGEFDAADVQQMMNNLGRHLRFSFSRPIPRGRRLREMKRNRAKREKKQQEAKRQRRESHLNQMRELRNEAEVEGAKGNGSAMVTLEMAGEQVGYSMEIACEKAVEGVFAASVEADVECVESTIKDNLRQYLPWFTILQICVCFGLWLGYALQTNQYEVLADQVSVDDSLLVGNFSGIVKYECQIECSHLGDACWGVAFWEGPATQCKLLSEAPPAQPVPNYCREGSWNWELSVKQPMAAGSLLGITGGLETVYPGQTLLQTSSYCEEGFLASIPWRLLSYQFTHRGLGHVGSNCLGLFLLSVPLEGFHGTGLIALMYTIGVVGGGLTWTLFNPHIVALGASGGVYALLGMHLADLALNWKQKKFRYTELFLLAGITGFEIVCTISSFQDDTSEIAYSAHIGGLVSGLLVGMVLTRNIERKRWERGLQAFALLAGAGLVCISLAWWFSNPLPGIRSLLSGGEGPLCWKGQVWSNADNTDFDYRIDWQCVACSTRECVEDWYKDELVFCVSSAVEKTCNTDFVDIVHNCQNC